MSVWVLIPAKSLSLAKSRLVGALTPYQRSNLVRDMLRNTIHCARRVRDVTQVAIVSDSPADFPYAVECIAEMGLGHNGGLQRASAVAQGCGAKTIVVISSDLPHLRPPDIEVMIETARAHACAIAPDELEAGTNGLALMAPTPFRFQFGENSFAAHKDEAIARRANNYAIVRRHGLAFDLDDPGGLSRLSQESRLGART